MKTRKKLLIALLSATCLTAGAFGIAACDKDANDKALTNIYNAYVNEANEKGETPLSYEEWLKLKLNSSAEKGEQGEKGEPGKNGDSAYEIYRDAEYAAGREPLTQAAWLASLNGVTPHIGTNGNWYLGDQDTGVKALAQNGTDGVGVREIKMSEDGKSLAVTFTSGDTVNVALPSHITHVHTYNNKYTVVIPSSGDSEGIGYKVCTDEACGHVELVVIGIYTYKFHVAYSDFAEDGVGTPAAGAEVKLLDANNEVVMEGTTDENGDVVFPEGERGEYKIVVTKDGYISSAELANLSMFEKFDSKTDDKVADYQAVLLPKAGDNKLGDRANPVPINGTQDKELFYVHSLLEDGEVANTYIKYVAPKAGEYTFAAMVRKDGYPVEVNGGNSYTVLLDENESYELFAGLSVLATAEYGSETGAYTDEELSKFFLGVTYKETKANRGSKEAPVAAVKNAATTYTAKPDEVVYFKFAATFDGVKKFKFAFDESNVNVVALGDTPDAVGNELENGGVIRLPFAASSAPKYNYLAVSAKDGNISFTVSDHYDEGEIKNPITLELGKEVSTADILANHSDFYGNVWFKFDFEAEGKYSFENSGRLNFSIYDKLDEENAKHIYSATDELIVYNFDAGTYYIQVNGENTFKFREYDAENDAGFSKYGPKTITSEDKLEAVVSEKYYKYVAEKDGTFAVSAYGGSVSYFVYKDDSYEGNSLLFNYYAAQNYKQVTAGEELYIKVSSYNKNTSFKCGVVDENDTVAYAFAIKTRLYGDLNGVENAKVTVKDEKGELVAGAEAITDADGNVTLNLKPGVYEVCLDLSNAVFKQDGKYGLTTTVKTKVSYGDSLTTIELSQVYDLELTFAEEGNENAVFSGMTAVIAGKEYTIGENNKVTCVSENVYASQISLKLEGTAYEKGYKVTVNKVSGTDTELKFSVTLSEALTEVPIKVEYDNEYEFTYNEGVELQFQFLSGTDGEFSITVTGGTIKYLTQNGQNYMPMVQQNGTYFANAYLWGNEKYVIGIVPDEGNESVTVNITANSVLIEY